MWSTDCTLTEQTMGQVRRRSFTGGAGAIESCRVICRRRSGDANGRQREWRDRSQRDLAAPVWKALESGASVIKDANTFRVRMRYIGGAVDSYAPFRLDGNLV